MAVGHSLRVWDLGTDTCSGNQANAARFIASFWKCKQPHSHVPPGSLCFNSTGKFALYFAFFQCAKQPPAAWMFCSQCRVS